MTAMYHHPCRNSDMRSITNKGSSCMPVKEYGSMCRPDLPTPSLPMRNEIPANNRQQLFQYISEVSFAIYEVLLYLDTHPDDKDAISYFQKYSELRNLALKEYAKRFGPLTISTADDCSLQCWEWMNQPWPWEGGEC